MFFWLDQNLFNFPSVDLVHPTGIIAFGGDLQPERLYYAYSNGIFPWYEDGEVITWWAPKERMLVFPQTYVPRKSLRQLVNKSNVTVTRNQAFEQVIKQCQTIPREGQKGTWITDDMKRAYIDLYYLGKAQSVEVWRDEMLIGGLYGVDLKGVFCGESMFSVESNASKIAFVYLIDYLKAEGYQLLDCQVYNSYLDYLGAQLFPRNVFMRHLKNYAFTL